jgi:hypothetical protein
VILGAVIGLISGFILGEMYGNRVITDLKVAHDQLKTENAELREIIADIKKAV